MGSPIYLVQTQGIPKKIKLLTIELYIYLKNENYYFRVVLLITHYSEMIVI